MSKKIEKIRRFKVFKT